MQIKPGFAMFWNSVATPEMRPAIYLSFYIEILMTVSFHERHRTSISLTEVVNITAAV